MFRNTFSFAGTLLLVGTVVLATPGLSQAQRGHAGGGFHGGGFHGGGFHGGGFHGGGFRGGFHGDFHGGTHFGRGFFPRSRFFGYPSYGYGYSYPYSYGYPYLYDYPYDTSYFYSYPYSYPYSYSYPYYGYSPYGDLNVSWGSALDQGGSALSDPAPDTTAHVTVNVPADAQVWFEGAATKSTGPVREFYSPPLSPGSGYTYEIRARWNENGHDVTQTQQVNVNPGSHTIVKFPLLPEAAVQAPVAKKD
jgi:uncharacterized protein (TIGR03000 family)